MNLQRASIIGLGLIGGSLGGALRRQGVVVTGFDVRPAAGKRAQEAGLVDSIGDSMASAVDGSDAVIVSVPPAAVVELLPQIDTLAPASALILDTASVKGPIVDMMAGLAGGQRCIGGHPLAGKERSGPEAADPGLFDGRRFLLTPSGRTDDTTITRAEEMAQAVGAVPLVLTAERHDEVLARTSHLPQVLASALAAGLLEGDGRLSGPALADMTRLAASDPIMWRDILLLNRAHLAREAAAYRSRLDGLLAALETSDVSGIEAFLQAGRAGRRIVEGAAA